MPGALIRSGQFGYRGIESGRRWGDTWVDRGKDCNDVSTTQKMQGVAGLQDAGRDAWYRFSPQRHQEGSNLLTLSFWTSASRAVRQRTYAVWSHPLSGTSLPHPSESNRCTALCLTNAVNNICWLVISRWEFQALKEVKDGLQMQASFFFFLILFIWLHWVLVAAFGIFVSVLRLGSWGARAQLPCSMWNLSSPTKDQTHTSCIARWILNH